MAGLKVQLNQCKLKEHYSLRYQNDMNVTLQFTFENSSYLIAMKHAIPSDTCKSIIGGVIKD